MLICVYLFLFNSLGLYNFHFSPFSLPSAPVFYHLAFFQESKLCVSSFSSLRIRFLKLNEETECGECGLLLSVCLAFWATFVESFPVTVVFENVFFLAFCAIKVVLFLMNIVIKINCCSVSSLFIQCQQQEHKCLAKRKLGSAAFIGLVIFFIFNFIFFVSFQTPHFLFKTRQRCVCRSHSCCSFFVCFCSLSFLFSGLVS